MKANLLFPLRPLRPCGLSSSSPLSSSMRPNSPLLPTGTIAAPPAQLRMPAAEWTVGPAGRARTDRTVDRVAGR